MFGICEKIYNFVKRLKSIIMRRKKETQQAKDPAYFLFVFGDFTELETLIEDFSLQFLPIVSSPFLKFTYGEYGVVFHFRSAEKFVELKQYVDMVLEGITEQYFLIEVGKNIDIKMDKKLKKDFLNIDGNIKKEENKVGEIDVQEKKQPSKDIKNIAFEFMIPMIDPSVFLMQTEDIYEPSVDEILDKINERGIESLTEIEIKILENYGKGKK